MPIRDDEFSDFEEHMRGHHPEISDKELHDIFESLRNPQPLSEEERKFGEELAKRL
jgi:hypothetical protein